MADCQSKTCAAELARDRTIGLLERLEDDRKSVCGNADSRIHHLNDETIARLVQGCHDFDAATIRKLDGVTDEFNQQLSQPCRVRADEAWNSARPPC